MIGLKRGTVKLAVHHPSWAKLFAKEKKFLENNLGKQIIKIEHVGSTAVRGLAAKPIIDIAIGVKKIGQTGKLIKSLEALGYRHGKSQRHDLFFDKGPESRRTHHLHVVRYGGVNWKNYLLFVKHLNSRSKRLKQYEALKKKLAKKFAADRKSYTAGKNKFIKETIKLASAKKMIA